MRGKHKLFKGVGFLLAIGLVMFILVNKYVYHQPSDEETDEMNKFPRENEPAAHLVFEANWGDEEGQLGFYNASGVEGDVFSFGFESFFIDNNKVFIADLVESQISLFEVNKFTRAYNYLAEQDEGLIATDEHIFLLGSLGRLNKIRIDTGEYVQVKLAIKEEQGFLSHFAYTMYKYDKLAIVYSIAPWDVRCFSLDDLSQVECPFEDKKGNVHKIYLYLMDGRYVTLEGLKTFWLHDKNGNKIGVVRGAFDHEYLYEMRRYQVSSEGVYYVVQSKIGAKIYFKPWQR